MNLETKRIYTFFVEFVSFLWVKNCHVAANKPEREHPTVSNWKWKLTSTIETKKNYVQGFDWITFAAEEQPETCNTADSGRKNFLFF